MLIVWIIFKGLWMNIDPVLYISKRRSTKLKQNQQEQKKKLMKLLSVIIIIIHYHKIKIPKQKTGPLVRYNKELLNHTAFAIITFFSEISSRHFHS